LYERQLEIDPEYQAHFPAPDLLSCEQLQAWTNRVHYEQSHIMFPDQTSLHRTFLVRHGKVPTTKQSSSLTLRLRKFSPRQFVMYHCHIPHTSRFSLNHPEKYGRLINYILGQAAPD